MKAAIGETERRRAKQMAFNEANGITPKSVTSASRTSSTVSMMQDQRAIDVRRRGPERLRGP
jgi:excinuclease UvrABC helicase subunit UvrB